MSVKLRLRRMGRKKLPVWGLVAADSRSPRDGRFIEDLGRYEPVQEPAFVKINHERAVYWLLEGAQPSDTVRDLLQRDGVLLRAAMTRKGAEAEAIEQAVAEFKERQAARDEKKNAKPTTSERRQKALDAERETAKERAAELAKERAEKEAELERMRKDTEEKERAEKEAQLNAAAEEARAAKAAEMGDADGAGESAGNAPAAATADGDTTVESVQGDMSNADTGNDAPITDAPAEDAAAQKAAELEAGDASQADEVQADAQQAVEAAQDTTDGDSGIEVVKAQAAAAEDTIDDAAGATAGDVSDEAPDSAEQQPAVEDATTEAVAADAGEAVAEQADAGAADEPEVGLSRATTTPADDATAEPVAGESAAVQRAAAADDVVPAGTEATPTANVGGEKLTDMWGIGPKYAGILTDAGVTTFADVASKSTEELQAIITDAGSSAAGNEDTWVKQAELLALGDSDAFDAYVEELKNA